MMAFLQLVLPLIQVQCALLMSAALLVLLLLRPLLRALGGAGAIYLAWLAVPVAVAAAWLPAPAAPQALVSKEVAHAAATIQGQVSFVPSGKPDLERLRQQRQLVFAVWAAGALLLLGSVAIRHRRWLGKLQPGSGPLCLPAGEGPGVVGLLRPRVVLPVDFEDRFSPAEQRLVLAHEAVHARRRDNVWSLLAAIMLALQWFNPLAWWALRRFRRDQELACDEAALHGGEGCDHAAYTSALLKAHDFEPSPPLACCWASGHPLVERLTRLPHARLGALRRHSAKGLALAASLLMAGAVYATHGARISSYDRDGKPDPWQVRYDATAPEKRLLLTLRTQIDGGQWLESAMPMMAPMAFTTFTESLGPKQQVYRMHIRTDIKPEEQSVTFWLTEVDDKTFVQEYTTLQRGERKLVEVRTAAGHRVRAEFELR